MKILPISVAEPTIVPLVKGRLDHLHRPQGALSALDPGDLLWLREPFRFRAGHDRDAPTRALELGAVIHFSAGTGPADVAMLGLGKRRMARELPRAGHRYHLLVTAIDLIDLQSVTEEEMRAQGYVSRNEWVTAWDKSMKDFGGRGQRWSDNPEILRIAFVLQKTRAPEEA